MHLVCRGGRRSSCSSGCSGEEGCRSLAAVAEAEDGDEEGKRRTRAPLGLNTRTQNSWRMKNPTEPLTANTMVLEDVFVNNFSGCGYGSGSDSPDLLTVDL